MAIYYFDALAGAGKTRALARHADKKARAGVKVLFAQPSKLLITNTMRDEIDPLGPTYPVRALHSDVSDNVIGQLVTHFREAQPGGELLFVTHAALMRLPYAENSEDWLLIMDEAPEADVFSELRIGETHHLLTDALEFQSAGAAYGRLLERDGGGLSKIARNRHGDEVYALLGDVAHRVTSKHWQVYALQSGYESLRSGDKANGSLITYSFLNPSIFQQFGGAIVASACFTDTVLYKMWKGWGVPMQPITGSLAKRLRYEAHQNGDRITILYVSDEDWSKTLRDRWVEMDGERVKVRDRLVDLISDAFGNEPFAYMANKDIPDTVFAHLSGAERLPNSPHGLNSYQHLHNIVVLSALNPPPTHFAFMSAHGIDAEELRTAHYRLAVYQAVMRISIRDPNDEHDKFVVVMDKNTAHWLGDLFPGSQVEELEGLGIRLSKGRAGRPRVHASDAARVRASRQRKLKTWFDDLREINGEAVLACSYGEFFARLAQAGAEPNSCYENTYIEDIPYHEVGAASPRLTSGTAYANKYATSPITHLDIDSDEDFIRLLRDLHAEKAMTKEDNVLLSPAHFEPNKEGVETKRGLANITHVRGIWLDNDGGDLDHREFARLFPYLRIVTWNTHSSRPDNPRWRAFIPTSYAMSVEVHRCIMQQIEKVLRDAGYRSDKEIEKLRGRNRKEWKRHGFDTSKFNAASLFYAPCQAADPTCSFFVDYNDVKRGPLDLYAWIENCILDLRPEPEPTAPTTTNVIQFPTSQATAEVGDGLRKLQARLRAEQKSRNAGALQSRVQKAIDEWRSAPRGQGHEGFYRLGAALQWAGLDEVEIEQKLREEASFARSPRDRRQEIRGIMRSLNRRGTLKKIA